MNEICLKTKVLINGKEIELEILDIDFGCITGIAFNGEYFITAMKSEELEMKDGLKNDSPKEQVNYGTRLFIRNDSRLRDAQGRKQCSKCKQWFPETEFYPGKKTKDGLRTYCKVCFNRYNKRIRKIEQETKLKELQEKGFTLKGDADLTVDKNTDVKKHEVSDINECKLKTKICTSCKIEKPLSDFNKNKASKYGVNSKCRDCINKYMHNYHKKKQEEEKKGTEPEITSEKKAEPILFPEEKTVHEGKAPDNTSLFLNWLEGRHEFNINDFVGKNPIITLEHAKTIVAYQIRKHKLVQMSSVDFKVL